MYFWGISQIYWCTPCDKPQICEDHSLYVPEDFQVAGPKDKKALTFSSLKCFMI